MRSMNFKLNLAALTAVVCFGLAGTVLAEIGDWPQWRGPKRDNISTETGLLKEWPKDGPPLLWKATGLGAGYSTISVVGGKLYTMGDDGGDTYALALDSEGKKIWSTKIGKTGGGGGYQGPRCTPTVSDGHIYILTDVGDLACLDDAGKIVWQISLAKDLKGQMMSGWGYAESPTIDRDKVIVAPGGKDGTVAALDKATGKLLWRCKELTDRASYASLVPAEINGTHQYVILTDASVAGIGEDGALLWRTDRKGATAVIPTPVVKDNVVFVTSGYNVGCSAYKINGTSTSMKADKIFENKEMKVHHGGVICIGDDVFGASDPGILVCMSLKDGSVVWKDRSVGKGSLACADGMLYLRSEGAGEVALVEASTEKYVEHGRFKQPDRTNKNAWAHPVIAGGKLYLRDQDLLFCYDIKAK